METETQLSRDIYETTDKVQFYNPFRQPTTGEFDNSGDIPKASYITVIINQYTYLFERIEYIKRLSGVFCQVCV